MKDHQLKILQKLYYLDVTKSVFLIIENINTNYYEVEFYYADFYKLRNA